MTVAIMNHHRWLPLVVVLIVAPGAFGAAKEPALPDKEMLKMMEFLREMEMVKQLEMMRELDRAESLDEPAKNSLPHKPASKKVKEASK
jgi:hypothetical protein